ncbi:antigen 5 like allergen Cul n 1-like [Anopheles bellator]|uniref:antigen 5 like allergen Cul n 1-like n=1 Tax=Anopheles bellator TaxID=139047 RepID=UPI002648C5CA|nr:antigen 5 like allergen Cul n 1-like [Anopheles bellator]
MHLAGLEWSGVVCYVLVATVGIWSSVPFGLQAADVGSSGDYCDPSLCSSNHAHIGCNRSKDAFGELCPSQTVQLVPMDASLKELILKLHNSLRSELASGKMEGFAPAQRMAVLEWDDELALLAEYNARSCLYSRDECRNTGRYRNVGQNIGRKSRPGNGTIDLERAISDLTNKWWQEYVDTNQTVMDDYRQVGEGVHVLHFALMANDRVTKVGCGATRYYNEPNKRSYVYYVCNYSHSTAHGQPVYRKGAQCAGCGPSATDGSNCSSTYAGLCEGSGDAIDKQL